VQQLYSVSSQMPTCTFRCHTWSTMNARARYLKLKKLWNTIIDFLPDHTRATLNFRSPCLTIFNINHDLKQRISKIEDQLCLRPNKQYIRLNFRCGSPDVLSRHWSIKKDSEVIFQGLRGLYEVSYHDLLLKKMPV